MPPTAATLTIVDMACGSGAITQLIAEEVARRGYRARILGVAHPQPGEPVFPAVVLVQLHVSITFPQKRGSLEQPAPTYNAITFNRLKPSNGSSAFLANEHISQLKMICLIKYDVIHLLSCILPIKCDQLHSI